MVYIKTVLLVPEAYALTTDALVELDPTDRSLSMRGMPPGNMTNSESLIFRLLKLGSCQPCDA